MEIESEEHKEWRERHARREAWFRDATAVFDHLVRTVPELSVNDCVDRAKESADRFARFRLDLAGDMSEEPPFSDPVTHPDRPAAEPAAPPQQLGEQPQPTVPGRGWGAWHFQP